MTRIACSSAQALCLEEMLGVRVSAGALYYGKRKRRTEVAFDDGLRRTTETAAARLHKLIESRTTPPAYREPKCDRCSLLNLCLPHALLFRFQIGQLSVVRGQLHRTAHGSSQLTTDN